MIKKATGKTFVPQEFRLLNQCVECGKATSLNKWLKCPDCVLNNLKKCKICDVLLRDGEYTFYTYDIKEEHRGGDFKASKELVREFSYIKVYFPHECHGWEKDIKNECFVCKKDFHNTEKNYIQNGNTCQSCSIDINNELQING